MADSEEEEQNVMYREFQWLLKEEVQSVLSEAQSILTECCRRFAVQNINYGDEENLVQPEKFLLSSSNGSSNVKCMVTLMADSICEADISLKIHKQPSIGVKSAIQPNEPWRLHQIQDAGNYLCNALLHICEKDKDHTFKSGSEILTLLDEVIRLLTLSRSSLVVPKRKTLEELVHNRYMKTLNPPVPHDTVLSFYVQAQKLILAVYQLTLNQNQRYDIGARYQVECAVPWLNETIVLFTLALQLCQQLRDKVKVFIREDLHPTSPKCDRQTSACCANSS
ncbi:protein rogdi-like [Lineus longissimus]|uniref:protein rogdi-like n=1 Tax=Lineus longissimus TaxID=88925 RepID=UPI002B4CFFDC